MTSGYFIKDTRKNISNSDAIRIHDDDIINLRIKKLHEIEDITKIWSFKYGTFILIGFNTITNSLIYGFHLKKFQGKIAFRYTLPIIPAILLPSLVGGVFAHNHFKKNLLKQSKYNVNECILCYELRSSLINLSIGSFIPPIASWSGLAITSYVLQIINPPKLSLEILKNKEQREKIFNYYWKLFKKTNTGFGFKFSLIIAFQLIAMSTLFYFMLEQFFNIEDKLELNQDDINDILNVYSNKK
jgi:hypothetical protein